jgi:hypothetical protein
MRMTIFQGVVSAMVQIGLEPSIYVTLSTFGLFVGIYRNMLPQIQ